MKTITNDRILILDFTLTLLFMTAIFLLTSVCVEFIGNFFDGLDMHLLEFKSHAGDYHAAR